MEKGAETGNTDNDLAPLSPPAAAATLEEHGPSNGGDAVEEAFEYEKDVELHPSESHIRGEGDDGKPKLADGYYEIEAVRRKRIRKGKAQYLIKWRDWEESANTWEPVANLRQCSDFIDAFEQSLKSTEQIRSTRKRKRKKGVIRVLKKKKKKKNKKQPFNNNHNPPQTLSPSAATYSVPSHVVTIIEEEEPFEMSEKIGSFVRKDDELDLKLCELARESRSRKVEPVRSGPLTGAKKRKSGPVKRFKKKEGPSCGGGEGDDGIYSGVSPPIRVKNREFGDSCRRALEDSKSLWNITEIIRPVNYKKEASVEDGRQEIFLAFEAMRSDGTKVVVDNKILKANNPLLLIDYYEKHLTYTPK